MAHTKLEARDVKPADAGTVHWMLVGIPQWYIYWQCNIQKPSSLNIYLLVNQINNADWENCDTYNLHEVHLPGSSPIEITEVMVQAV